MSNPAFGRTGRDPSAPRGTLSGNYRRAVLTIACLAILLLSVLTALFTWVSFRLQGEYLVSQLAGLAQSQLLDLLEAAPAATAAERATSDASTIPSAAQDVSATAPDPAGLHARMTAFTGSTLQYERIPGMRFLTGKATAETTIRELARFRILWNGSTLYEDADWAEQGTGLLFDTLSPAGLFRPLFDSEAKIPLDPAGTGTVQVRLVPDYWAGRFGGLLLGLLVVAALSVWLMLPFSRHFARYFSHPFAAIGNQLKKMADGEFQDALQTRIKVKRPLKELQAIAADANALLDKMRTESDLSTRQLDQLSSLNREWADRNRTLETSRDEIRNAQIQVINSQSLASVGQLTAAISHEITTPLERVTENMVRQQMLLERMTARDDLQSLPEVQRDVLAQLTDTARLSRMALDRVSALMASLKSFSRPDRADAEPADLNECLRSVVLLTSNLWKRRIRMQENYGDLPRFPFHPGLIGQVVINLVVNAVHAIEGEGEITIRTWQEGRTAFFRVSDTGSGIPEDVLPHIFESGYTTKSAGKGSGLGLAICVEILRQHEGTIDVSSTPGSGTVFTVSLPMGDSEPAASPEMPNSAGT